MAFNILSTANHHVEYSEAIRDSVIRVSGPLMTAELHINIFPDDTSEINLIVNETSIPITSEDMFIDVHEDFGGCHVLSLELGGTRYKSRSRLKLLCLIISSKLRSSQDTKGLECLLLREAESPQARRAGNFERYGYVRISEYSIQGRLGVHYHEIKNAEWFPQFQTRDPFGRCEIDII
jgi:hypothetical protein